MELNLETLSITVSLTSLATGLILSALAIILSIIFYKWSSRTQSDAQNLLTKIETQLDQLRSINDNLLKKAVGDVGDIARMAVYQGPPRSDAEIPDFTELFAKFNHDQRVDDQDTENVLRDHGLWELPDPLTAGRLRFEIAAVYVMMFNAMGWINQHGQGAFLHYSSASGEPGGPLHQEFIDNLNRSKAAYEALQAQIEKIREQDPELYGNHSAAVLYENTCTRFSNLIYSYHETQRKFHVGDNLELYAWPDAQSTGQSKS